LNFDDDVIMMMMIIITIIIIAPLRILSEDELGDLEYGE